MNFTPNLLLQAAAQAQSTPQAQRFTDFRPVSGLPAASTPVSAPLFLQPPSTTQFAQEHLKCSADDVFKLQNQVNTFLYKISVF